MRRALYMEYRSPCTRRLSRDQLTVVQMVTMTYLERILLWIGVLSVKAPFSLGFEEAEHSTGLDGLERRENTEGLAYSLALNAKPVECSASTILRHRKL